METVGSMLYKERIKKGLEIDQIEQATGIRRLYLQALEQDNFQLLPGEVYVKGFLRNYGIFLGLDGLELIRIYNLSKQPATTAQNITNPTKKTGRIKKTASRISFVNQNLVVAGLLLVLLGAAWGLFAWMTDPSPSDPQSTSPSFTKLSYTRQPASGRSADSPSTPQSTSSHEILLTARYTDRCWTSVVADGQKLYEGIPPIGETIAWVADRQIVVNFGNAAAVELTFNGQPVGKIGERGAVVVKTFTANAALTEKPNPSGSIESRP